MNQDFAICIQFSKENLRKTIDLCYNIDVSRALLASEREVFLFFPFSSLAKVNNVLQSEQTRKRSISSSMAMFLFLDQAFILPFATFFTPIFLRGHFSPLITFFFFFSFVAHFLQVTSRRFVAFLQEGNCVETQFRATWIFGFKADGRSMDSSSSPNKCLLTLPRRGPTSSCKSVSSFVLRVGREGICLNEKFLSNVCHRTKIIFRISFSMD